MKGRFILESGVRFKGDSHALKKLSGRQLFFKEGERITAPVIARKCLEMPRNIIFKTPMFKRK
jgi:hypothetical protein